MPDAPDDDAPRDRARRGDDAPDDPRGDAPDVPADEADGADEEPGRPADAADEEPATSSSRTAPSGRLRVAQGVALVVAVVLLAWSLQAYLAAASDRDDLVSQARVRDDVQVSAANAVEVLNTLDYRDVETGLEAWAAVSTGDLREELTDLSDQQRDALSEVARISEGAVVSSAVTRLDAAGGTASVICFVERQVADSPEALRKAAPSRVQFTVDLREVDGDWLVTTLTPVAVVTPEGEDAP